VERERESQRWSVDVRARQTEFLTPRSNCYYDDSGVLLSEPKANSAYSTNVIARQKTWPSGPTWRRAMSMPSRNLTSLNLPWYHGCLRFTDLERTTNAQH